MSRPLETFDVAIIGGGPAGASAALTLRKRPDLRVCVPEAAPGPRRKVGESLSPGVRSLIGYLGVWDSVTDGQSLDLWGSEAAWGSDTMVSLDYIHTLHGSGWSLDRARFDRSLLDAADTAGAEVMRGTRVTGLRREGEGWSLSLDGPEAFSIRARYVIDAAGRASPWSAKAGFQRKRHDNLVAATRWFDLGISDAPTTVTRVESVAEGWWYAAVVPGPFLVVSFMTDAAQLHARRLKTARGWWAALQRTQHIAEIVRGREDQRDPDVAAAHSSVVHPPMTAVPLTVAGDAAASHDPLSSSGIPHALGSGIQAGRVAADALFGNGALAEAYHASLAADFRRYLNTQWMTYCLETRFPQAPFWASRQRKASVAPEALCTADPEMIRAAAPLVPRRVLRTIETLAREPRPAHRIVADLRAMEPSMPDETLILAIQETCRIRDRSAPASPN